MNTIQAFIVLGLIFLYLPMAVSPIANVSSQINDQSGMTGIGGFIFGNLGFIFIFLFIITIYIWMWTG